MPASLSYIFQNQVFIDNSLVFPSTVSDECVCLLVVGAQVLDSTGVYRGTITGVIIDEPDKITLSII